MFYIVSRLFLKLLFKIFFRFKAYGTKDFPRSGPLIVASNHASYFDPIIVGVAAPIKLNYLARESLFRNAIFGTVLRLVNVYPLKREGGDIGAFRLALSKLREGKPILIFPEGTRSEDGSLQQPKHGIGFLQASTGADILPCYVKGSHNAWPRFSRFPRFVPVSVYFGKILKFDNNNLPGNKKERYSYVAREVMSAISELKAYADKGSS